MSTKILSFNRPLNPQPNANNSQSVLKTGDGWTLTVKKTGMNREISIAAKTATVSLSSTHYGQFCTAFTGGSGAKTVTLTHNNGIVQSIKWDTTTVVLPDGSSIAPLAMATELPDEQQDSTRLG